MPFLSNIGTPELIVIAVVLLVFFGGKKVNELANGLGQSSKELKKVRHEFEEALKDEAQIITTVEDKVEVKKGKEGGS